MAVKGSIAGSQKLLRAAFCAQKALARCVSVGREVLKRATPAGSYRVAYLYDAIGNVLVYRRFSGCASLLERRKRSLAGIDDGHNDSFVSLK